MRRWARTRFIPDDWGLKPPIDTLPQIAQERAMRGPQDRSRWRCPSPEGRERSGRIAHGLRRPARTHADPPPRGGRSPACRPTRDPGRSLVDAPGRRPTSSAPRRSDRTASPGSPAARSSGSWPGSASPSRASPSASATALDIELDLTVAYGVPIAEVARQVDSAVRYALRHALDREVDRLTIHVDGLRFGPRGAPPTAHRRDPSRRRSGRDDLADSGTDVA